MSKKLHIPDDVKTSLDRKGIEPALLYVGPLESNGAGKKLRRPARKTKGLTKR